jgi:hypothetical protein
VGPVPVYDGSLPILLAMAQKNHKYTAIWERLAPGFGGVDEQLEAHAGTWHYQYLSAYKAICGSGQCALYADREQEVPMLVDTNHLSNGGAQWLTDRWVAAHQLW